MSSDEIKALTIVSGIDIPDWYDPNTPYIISPSSSLNSTMKITDIPSEIYNVPIRQFYALLLNSVRLYNKDIIAIHKISWSHNYENIISIDIELPNINYNNDIEDFKLKMVQWNDITRKLNKLKLI